MTEYPNKQVAVVARKLPPAAGMGRPKGTPNKTTALLKDAILKAAENAGNKIGKNGLISYLEVQAMENPAPFLALLGKVMPLQVIGDPENPLQHTHEIVMRIVRPEPK